MTKPKLKLNTLELETPPSTSLRIKCQRIKEGKHPSYSLFRYAVFDLEYKTSDGRTESKLIFILYAPDICDSKEKFVYATTKEEVRKKVSPFNKELQVNDWADLDAESFIKHFHN